MATVEIHGKQLGWCDGQTWFGLFEINDQESTPSVTRGRIIFPEHGDFEYKGDPQKMLSEMRRWAAFWGFIKSAQESGRLTCWRD